MRKRKILEVGPDGDLYNAGMFEDDALWIRAKVEGPNEIYGVECRQYRGGHHKSFRSEYMWLNSLKLPRYAKKTLSR